MIRKLLYVALVIALGFVLGQFVRDAAHAQAIGAAGQGADACQANPHSWTPINISTAANTKIVAGTANKKTYICYIFLFSAGTQNVGIVEGSGTNCATSTLGLIGGATAATGPNLTAQTGFVQGTGQNAVAASTVNANDFCLITSAAIQLSGVAVTVQQ